MSDNSRCVIATRESPLALWQAEHVKALLENRYEGMAVELLGMTTKGDQILDKTLSKGFSWSSSRKRCGRERLTSRSTR